jgi:elongation factor Ts
LPRPTPRYVDITDVPEADLAAKRAEILGDPATAGKPAEIREKIVDGQLKKWFKEVVLLEQPYRDEDYPVRDLVTRTVAKMGENVRVRRFVRYALGEEL